MILQYELSVRPCSQNYNQRWYKNNKTIRTFKHLTFWNYFVHTITVLNLPKKITVLNCLKSVRFQNQKI